MRLLRSATWPTASVDPLFTVPIRRSTLSCCRSFSDLRTATRVGLLVFNQQLEPTTVHAAGGVDLIEGELSTPTHLLADRRIAARQRRHHSDLDRIGCVVVGPEAGCERDDRSAA